jgi:hypothetical protein
VFQAFQSLHKPPTTMMMTMAGFTIAPFFIKSRVTQLKMKFDRYLLTPPSDKKIKTLDYWRDHSHDFPHLNLIARDIFAVPATGAGVERMFSKSGRVATWTRARLNSMTIVETMLYKEFLGRLGHPLKEAEERRKVERKTTRRGRQLDDV